MKKSLLCGVLLTITSTLVPVSGQQAPNEIDEFMEKVLERREINWEETQTYLFHEREVIQIQGRDIPPIAGFDREFVWIARQGELLRSPVKVDGVKVSQKEQQERFG